jgi:hypothetical protein
MMCNVSLFGIVTMSPPVQGIYSNENEKIKRKLDISKNKF